VATGARRQRCVTGRTEFSWSMGRKKRPMTVDVMGTPIFGLPGVHRWLVKQTSNVYESPSPTVGMQGRWSWVSPAMTAPRIVRFKA
jgi:hypothetical protein